MLRKNRDWLMLAIVALLLGACSTTGETITVQPARLSHLEPEVSIAPLWYKQPQGLKEDDDSRLKPVIDNNGIMYVAESSGFVRAYRADNGRRVWAVKLDNRISGGVGSFGNLLLMGSHEGDVIALNKEDGAIVWHSNVSSEVLAPPQGAGDVVVVRSNDGKLFALGAQDGKRKWVYESTVPSLSLRGTGSPLIYRDEVICGFDSGKVAAISLSEGKLLWEATVAISEGRSELERMVDVDADPVILTNVLYAVAYQGRVVAIDINTGRQIWSRDIPSYAGISVDDDNLYITDEESNIWALDRRNGATLWKQDKLMARTLTMPVVVNRYIVIGDYQGYLHWLSRNDGRIVARYRMDDAGVAVAPLVVDEVLYAESTSGTRVALRTGIK